MPPAHPQHACLRAARYRQTSLADCHTSRTWRRTTWCPFYYSVKPTIYECNRIRSAKIGLVRAHISRYRTHIQHTRADKYSYPSAVAPRSHLLRRATTISRTPLVAAFDSHTWAACIPKCSGRLLVRADALVPPAHPQHACMRAARYRQTSVANRHIQDTAAHDLVPLLLALCPIFMNVKETNAAG